LSLHRVVRRHLRVQWFNVVGAAASIGGFLFNVFRPTMINFYPQSVVGGLSSGVGVSLGVVSVVLFGLFVSLYVYTHRRVRGRY
jgi:hypothetical protein